LYLNFKKFWYTNGPEFYFQNNLLSLWLASELWFLTSTQISLCFFSSRHNFFFLLRVGNTIEQVTRGQDDKIRVNKTSYSILELWFNWWIMPWFNVKHPRLGVVEMGMNNLPTGSVCVLQPILDLIVVVP